MFFSQHVLWDAMTSPQSIRFHSKTPIRIWDTFHTKVPIEKSYTFTIYGHLVKKPTFKFLKDALVIKLSGKMHQGGLIFAS